MCTTCGCSDDANPTLTDLQTGETSSLAGREIPGHDHDHDHDHVHRPTGAAAVVVHPSRSEGRTIRLEQAVLAKNNQLAERNRG